MGLYGLRNIASFKNLRLWSQLKNQQLGSAKEGSTRSRLRGSTRYFKISSQDDSNALSTQRSIEKIVMNDPMGSPKENLVTHSGSMPGCSSEVLESQKHPSLHALFTQLQNLLHLICSTFPVSKGDLKFISWYKLFVWSSRRNLMFVSCSGGCIGNLFRRWNIWDGGSKIKRCFEHLAWLQPPQSWWASFVRHISPIYRVGVVAVHDGDVLLGGLTTTPLLFSPWFVTVIDKC